MIINNFEKGPENWASYDYHRSMISGGNNVFVLANWIDDDGPDNSNFIWTDHTHWSVDIPENPISVLALLTYRNWTNENKIDLRDAEVEVYLGNKDLSLYGGKCHFWILGKMDDKDSARWHLNKTLDMVANKWVLFKFKLENNENKWHNSWKSKNKHSLSEILENVESYGFSFTGFSAEPTGKFCISKFKITKEEKWL